MWGGGEIIQKNNHELQHCNEQQTISLKKKENNSTFANLTVRVSSK